MIYKLGRKEIVKLIIVCFTFFSTILLPFINYIIFKTTDFKGIELGGLENKYNLVIVAIIIIGICITICSYLFFQYPKNSIKRGVISLTHSILDVVFLSVFSQMAVINIFFRANCSSCGVNSIYGTSLNLSGIFVLLIVFLSLFVLKSIYDLIDFKLNENYYDTLRRRNRSKVKQDMQKLLKCSNCGYICRLEWKKCPTCDNSL